MDIDEYRLKHRNVISIGIFNKNTLFYAFFWKTTGFKGNYYIN